MILSLLERLEQEGSSPAWGSESLIPVLAPERWYRSAGARPEPLGEAASTSGRLSTPSFLSAERTDDGVFVAAPSTSARERIVWVGDLELDCTTHASAELGSPTFEFHENGFGLDLTWTSRASTEGRMAHTPFAFRMRLTLPCRPIGELSFRNEELDPEVWLCATQGGRMAARIRPYAALPELEIAPGAGTLDFTSGPDWRLGVEVMDPDGTLRVEDRFSPGTFRLQLPEGERAVRLSIRIVPSNAAERGRRGGALGRLMGQLGGEPKASPPSADELRLSALTLPGELLHRGATALEAKSELRELLVAAADHVLGARFDVALMAARAALLIAPGWAPDVTSVTLPFLRGVVGRIERDDAAAGCPGAAAAGLPRWCGPTGSLAADAIPIEYAALLHQSCQHAADLAASQGDLLFARQARRQARRLRRWFQEKYWLARPDRAADLVYLGATDPAPWDRVRALCLRPHMLLAASFEGTPFSKAQRRMIVRVTETRLLVPSLGVATLDCDDLEFQGNSAENGAIWPFMIGPFVEASLRAFGPDRGRHRMLAHLVARLGDGSAPMAWAHSAGHPISPAPYADLEPVHSQRIPMPIGPLQWALNTAEAARAKALLS